MDGLILLAFLCSFPLPFSSAIQISCFLHERLGVSFYSRLFPWPCLFDCSVPSTELGSSAALHRRFRSGLDGTSRCMQISQRDLFYPLIIMELYYLRCLISQEIQSQRHGGDACLVLSVPGLSSMLYVQPLLLLSQFLPLTLAFLCLDTYLRIELTTIRVFLVLSSPYR